MNAPARRRRRQSRTALVLGGGGFTGGVKIAFRATSSDIPRTLWFPTLNFHRRLYPGEEATFTLTFPQDRLTTSGACSVGCGGTRSVTQFDVEVLTSADFKAWVKASH